MFDKDPYDEWDFQGPPIMGPLGPHTVPIRIPKDMGIVWQAYHKGVSLLESLESPLTLDLHPRMPVAFLVP